MLGSKIGKQQHYCWTELLLPLIPLFGLVLCKRFGSPSILKVDVVDANVENGKTIKLADIAHFAK